MKRGFIYGLVMVLLAAVGCTKDETLYDFEAGQGETLLIDFSHKNFEDLQLNTRGLAEEETEWRVSNMFVCIFENEGGLKGKRVYAHTFKNSDLVGSLGEVSAHPQDLNECWFVHNKSADSENTNGRLKLTMPSLVNGKVYLIANVNLLDLSPELLDIYTSTEENLRNLFVTASATTIYRTGLIMTGKVEGVKYVKDQPSNPSNKQGHLQYVADASKPVVINMKRIDARVSVNVRIQSQKERDDADKVAATPNESPYLRAFHPVKWELVNMPRNMRLVEDSMADDMKGDPEQAKKYRYFNLPESNFETVTPAVNDDKSKMTNLFGEQVTIHGFGFYMLENLQHDYPTEPPGHKLTFHERDKRKKKTDGAYEGLEGQGDIWEFAPELSTYMKVSGQLEMVQRNLPGGSSASKQLFADVTYYIHLGCGAVYNAKGQKIGESNYNDFSVRRNTKYTYNIKILGVNSILVEVNTSEGKVADQVEEHQPAVTGDTFEALEAYYKFDAHFSQRVFRFRAEHMQPNSEGLVANLTWYVETPFSEGSPHVVGSSAGALDYKWVKFLRNNSTTTTDGKVTAYSKRNRYYPGDAYAQRTDIELHDRLMDVNVFTEYLINQAQLYWNNVNNPTGLQVNTDFAEEMIDGKKYHCIYFTLFIDEYFYDRHPISGAPLPWTEFVNCKDRMMHLLCSTNRSLDKDSSVTQSITTIRQRPIQTAYDIERSAGLKAWGLETVDEPVITQESVKSVEVGGESVSIPDMVSYPTWFRYENQPSDVGTLNKANEYNGRYNSLANMGNNSWLTYFDVTKFNPNNLNDHQPATKTGAQWESATWELPENGLSLLKIGKRTLVNSVLLRNRDQNGDGVIQTNEVLWYMASLAQLNELNLGDTGIAGEAKLYPADKPNYVGAPDDSWPTVLPAWVKGSLSPQETGNKKWRVHIVTSTVLDDKRPQILWAEEGFSTSPYWTDYVYGDKASYSMRCLRNLVNPEGENPSKEEIRTDELLDHLIFFDEVKTQRGKKYFLNYSRINRESLRHRGVKVDVDLNILDPSILQAESAFLPLGLETGDFLPRADVATDIGSTNGHEQFYRDVVSHLQQGRLICPPGWRVPNIREIVSFYICCRDTQTDLNWWGGKGVMSCTEFDLGAKINKTPSWSVTPTLITNSLAEVDGIRCVRDWDPR